MNRRTWAAAIFTLLYVGVASQVALARGNAALVLLVGAVAWVHFRVGLRFGALNEVIELAATLLVPETNVGGYNNTRWDLVADRVGAVVTVTLMRITWRPPDG